MRRVPGPVVLLILDGVGSNEPYPGNAVSLANTPFLESMWDAYPHGLLHASAEHVGLPVNVKGNSEVGHANIGAGQVVYQYLPRINTAIEKGTFFANEAIGELLDKVKNRGTSLHVMGCFSTGNTHASLEHFRAILEFCARKGVKNVFIHAFTDGRDTDPKAATIFFEQMDQWMTQYHVGEIATIIGRAYAMDRNTQWQRTQKAYELLTQHVGTTAVNWREVLAKSYEAGITDEFIEPFIIDSPSVKEKGIIRDGDSVLFMNFRPDRALQLTQALTLDDFTYFQRIVRPKDISMVTMVRYAKDLPVTVAFAPVDVKMPLGRVVSMAGFRQLRLAESEKFPHVTYFVNGGINTVYPGEMRINIPSPHVSTYDQKPEMSIYPVTEQFIKCLNYNVYDLMIMNFANGDMVGHTGVLDAGIRAMNHVDICTAQVVKQVLARNGAVFITADHGNVDEMTDPDTGAVNTDHSIYPVPFIAVYKDAKNNFEFPLGKLSDIAPTVLDFLGLEIPIDMTGRVLIER